MIHETLSRWEERDTLHHQSTTWENGKIAPEQSRLIRNARPALPQEPSQIAAELDQLFKTGYISNFATFATLLERQLSSLLGVKYAFTVPNGTTGLAMALSTLKYESDDDRRTKYEVLVPSFTFPATVNAIVHAGFRPRFVDVDLNTFNISPAEVRSKLSPHTKAIVAVHAFGNPCHVAELENIAEDHKLKLFFDAAAAFGSKYDSRYLGGFGAAEVFSLSGPKIVSAGEGGVITTNDTELAQMIKRLRNYGFSEDKRDCLYAGFNGKLNEFNALLALKSLDLMCGNLAHRNLIAQHYKSRLQSIPGITVQHVALRDAMNYSNFAIRIDAPRFGMNAAAVRERLTKKGIETIRYFCPALHRTTAYRHYCDQLLPNTDMLCGSVLCLPMHHLVSEAEARYICEVIVDLRARDLPLKHRQNGKPMTKRPAFVRGNEPTFSRDFWRNGSASSAGQVQASALVDEIDSDGLARFAPIHRHDYPASPH